MKHILLTITGLILSLIVILIPFSSANAAEIDDATVFVEAFNAYQQKDYLLTIEKCGQLNQVFPDSPLRDVTLLLVARASLKSGDNERAAKSIIMFSTEFPESSLKTSVEEELKTLANRHQKGEILAPDKTLRTEASKVRSDTVAREQAAALKLEKERLLAEKLAKESIIAAITPLESSLAVPVGGNGRLPIEIVNTGKNSEEFLLSVTAAKEYNAILTKADKPNENLTKLTLAAGETFNGSVLLRMPPEMVDGHRSSMTIKVVSAKFSDVSFQKETVVISSAPLVRAVAKLSKPKAAPGEKLRYRVTVLNAGSLPAQNLTVRLQLPPQIVFKGVSDIPFDQESDGTLVFKVAQVEIGKLVEIGLDVKVREDSSVGQELRGHVEVVNGSLQRKDIFTASASVAQAK